MSSLCSQYVLCSILITLLVPLCVALQCGPFDNPVFNCCASAQLNKDVCFESGIVFKCHLSRPTGNTTICQSSFICNTNVNLMDTWRHLQATVSALVHFVPRDDDLRESSNKRRETKATNDVTIGVSVAVIVVVCGATVLAVWWRKARWSVDIETRTPDSGATQHITTATT